jgi:hypothetical protein
MLRGGISMRNPKLTCIDITLDVPVTKEDILQAIQEELDNEFETDTIDDFSRVTITCDHQKPKPPVLKPRKKAKK